MVLTKFTNMHRKSSRLKKMNSVFSVWSFGGGTAGMYTSRACISEPTRTAPIRANRITCGRLHEPEVSRQADLDDEHGEEDEAQEVVRGQAAVPGEEPRQPQQQGADEDDDAEHRRDHDHDDREDREDGDQRVEDAEAWRR